MRPATMTPEEELLDVIHSLLWLRYQKWPLSESDLTSPFEQNTILPILPRVEAWDKKLNAERGPMRGVTQEERSHKRGIWPFR